MATPLRLRGSQGRCQPTFHLVPIGWCRCVPGEKWRGSSCNPSGRWFVKNGMDTAAMTDAPAPRPSELGIPPGDLWVFGYGSLMGGPGFSSVEWAPGLGYGGG